jgi:hypothetical protein
MIRHVDSSPSWSWKPQERVANVSAVTGIRLRDQRRRLRALDLSPRRVNQAPTGAARVF